MAIIAPIRRVLYQKGRNGSSKGSSYRNPTVGGWRWKLLIHHSVPLTKLSLNIASYTLKGMEISVQHTCELV